MGDKIKFSGLMEKISFLDKISLLSKAISDDENPTPGYMYNEITKISYESGSHCQDLLLFLVDQLSSKSCNVRLKVLKILHHITNNGHPEFKQGLRKRSLGITDSIQFSGPPDPLHGMANYLKVRQEASVLTAVLFNVDENEGASVETQSTTERPVMSGMGSSGGKFQGFGNMPIKPKSLGESLVTSVKGFAEKVMSPPHSQPYIDSASDKRFGDYQPVTMTTSMIDTSGSLNQDTGTTTHQQQQHANISQSMYSTSRSNKMHRSTARKQGVPGGGWADTEENNDDQSNSTKESITPDGRVQHISNTSINTESLTDRLQELKTEDYSTEENLVFDLVTDKESFSISHTELKNFTKQCSIVNCEYVLKLLTDKLQSLEENIQMRCMLLLEGLLRTDDISPDQIVSQCAHCLLNIYNTNSGVTKAKARKILRILEKSSSTANLIKPDNAETLCKDTLLDVIPKS